MKTFIQLTALLALLSLTTTLEAGPKAPGRGRGHHGGHRGHGRHHHHRHHGRGHGYGYGPGDVFLVDPVAPVEPGVVDPLFGEADVIRAIGEYNRNTSEAWINAEEARRRAIENHRYRVETRNELKRQWRERRDAKYRRPNRRQSIEQVSESREQDRLSREEFDRATGEIVWPEVLLDPQFDEYRLIFEELFAQPTTKESGPGSNLHRDVNELARVMKDQLRLQIGFMTSGDYIAAKKFIDRLLNEARDTDIQVDGGSAVSLLK